MLDPRKDFKFFIIKAKVLQMYREALMEARSFEDPDVRNSMVDMIKDEFRVLRRDPND